MKKLSKFIKSAFFGTPRKGDKIYDRPIKFTTTMPIDNLTFDMWASYCRRSLEWHL